MSADISKIVRRAAFEELTKVIRDAFLEGRDNEAMRILDSQEYRALKNTEHVGRRTFVGINSHHPLTPRAVGTLIIRPQVQGFKVDRVVVSPSCAESFTVVDLRVGNRSQLIQSSEIAGNILGISPSLDWVVTIPPDSPPAFVDEHGRTIPSISVDITTQGELALGQPIDFDICETSQDLVIIVHNIDDVPRMFRGAFLGQLLNRS